MSNEKCCASVQDGYGHHPGCENAPKPAGDLCGQGPTGAWEPGPESWTEDEQLPKLGLPVLEPSPADAVFGTDTSPAEGLFTWGPAYAVPVADYAEQAQQLRNEQYAKAGLPMPGDVAAGVLRHLLGAVHTTHADAEEYARIFNLGFAEAVEQYTGDGSIRTQEEFLTALDELLDHTLHAEGCYIDPNDTTCVCVIGKVRAVLPACMVKQPPPSGEGDLWSCVRTAHLASPDRHVWCAR